MSLNAAVLAEKLWIKCWRQDTARNVSALDVTKHCSHTAGKVRWCPDVLMVVHMLELGVHSLAKNAG